VYQQSQLPNKAVECLKYGTSTEYMAEFQHGVLYAEARGGKAVDLTAY